MPPFFRHLFPVHGQFHSVSVTLLKRPVLFQIADGPTDNERMLPKLFFKLRKLFRFQFPS